MQIHLRGSETPAACPPGHQGRQKQHWQARDQRLFRAPAAGDNNWTWVSRYSRHGSYGKEFDSSIHIIGRHDEGRKSANGLNRGETAQGSQ